MPHCMSHVSLQVSLSGFKGERIKHVITHHYVNNQHTVGG